MSLVKLTNSFTKTVFALNTNLILIAEREAENKLLTRVITQLRGDDGKMVAYSVMESPEEVADLIAKTLDRAVVPDAKPAALVAS
jgi:hypothetical protein